MNKRNILLTEIELCQVGGLVTMFVARVHYVCSYCGKIYFLCSLHTVKHKLFPTIALANILGHITLNFPLVSKAGISASDGIKGHTICCVNHKSLIVQLKGV